MSYVKREPLLQIAKELQGKVFGSPLIIKAIEEAPSEDVVEIVRCADCKYHRDLDGGVECTRMDGLLMVFPDDYCSYGRRTKE